MKKLLLLTVLAALPVASAHELVRDGAVGALLHIAPDDDPLVGQVTDMFFDLRQLGGKAVTLSQCNCSLKVTAEGINLSPALQAAGGHLSASVTFPKVGAYTLTLTGKLNSRPFTLRWTVRAEGR